MRSHPIPSLRRLILPAAILCIFAFPRFGQAQLYVQQNLVVNAATTEPSLNSAFTTIDPNLVNPWGMVQSATSPFWVSDQVKNVSTLYNGNGAKVPLTVNIPQTTFPPNGPTGVVFNTGTGFPLPTTTGTVHSIFIFANLNGQISGWNPGSTGGLTNSVAEIINTAPATIYTGLSINATGTLIYAANFGTSDGIQAFTNDWKPDTSLSFTDPNLPSGYEPYNVEDISGTLFVAYAQPKPGGVVVGAGLGAVAEFNATTGAFITQLVSPGSTNGLNAPWGMAMAPASWGKFGGDLLVGNFGSGWISAYDPSNGNFLGYLDSAPNTPIQDPAMWTLMFGTGGRGSNPNTLYITSGVDLAQDAGVMAAIDPSPEPATLLLFGGGILLLTFWTRRKTARA